MEELSERYREAPLDLVLDCVSSLEAKDRVFDYNARVHAAGILKREPNTSGSRSNYIVIGGGFGDWFRALMFRTAGINCFGASHELFWIVFPHSRPVLDELKAAVERGALRAFIEEVPVDGFAAVEPVREAFRRLHGRRVRGKLVFVL
uniref:Alcohol dehydrogenase-like C-terminal domain-containing protein n=1 Tax=Phaeomonas parva TaxID=124430 RepID=A0A7S1UCB8_9STRA|mmetsp:Transcript_41520/g.129987  ORF Transcript_41520/g.129987 Transcript_41520/m.129987 type:complete len:148 (+) Transcript_41520:138-581(+)